MTDYGYIPDRYELAREARAISQVPRFGRSSQFSDLFSFSNQEQTDYTMGLIFVTAFMLTFFFLWTMAIFVFMLLGQEEAGFLSGHPFVDPRQSPDAKPFRRPRRVRWTFLACNVLVIMFSVLFVTRGMSNIQETSATFDKSNEQIMTLTSESGAIATDLITVNENSKTIRDRLVDWMDNFCPGVDDLAAQTGVDFDAIAREATENMDALDDFVEDELSDFQTYLGKIEDATATVDNAIKSYNVSEWKVMLFVMPFLILPGLLLIGLLMTWFDLSFELYQCMTKYVFIPLFGICVVFCWIACSFSGLIAVSNGDFCSGGSTANYHASPDGTFLEMMEEQQFNENSIIYNVLKYYITGCSPDIYPYEFLEKYEDDLSLALDSALKFSDALNNTDSKQLQDACGSDFEREKELLNVIGTNLNILVKNVAVALRLVSCDSIGSLYANTFHTGTCTYAVAGFSWVFSSLLIVSFCSMLMITFRAALYDVIWFGDLDVPSTVRVVKDSPDRAAKKEKQHDYESSEENKEETHPNNDAQDAYSLPRNYERDEEDYSHPRYDDYNEKDEEDYSFPRNDDNDEDDDSEDDSCPRNDNDKKDDMEEDAVPKSDGFVNDDLGGAHPKVDGNALAENIGDNTKPDLAATQSGDMEATLPMSTVSSGTATWEDQPDEKFALHPM